MGCRDTFPEYAAVHNCRLIAFCTVYSAVHAGMYGGNMADYHQKLFGRKSEKQSQDSVGFALRICLQDSALRSAFAMIFIGWRADHITLCLCSTNQGFPKCFLHRCYLHCVGVLRWPGMSRGGDACVCMFIACLAAP